MNVQSVKQSKYMNLLWWAERGDVDDKIKAMAFERWKTIQGMQGVTQFADARLEGVPAEDEAEVALLGAVLDAKTNCWTVPVGEDLEPFAKWWPTIPEDLQIKKGQAMVTLDGTPRENYLPMDDVFLGGHTSIKSALLGALVVLSCLTFCLFTLHGYLSLLCLLPICLLVPHLLALYQEQRRDRDEWMFPMNYLYFLPLCWALLIHLVDDLFSTIHGQGIHAGVTGVASAFQSTAFFIHLGLFVPLVILLLLVKKFVGRTLLIGFDVARHLKPKPVKIALFVMVIVTAVGTAAFEPYIARSLITACIYFWCIPQILHYQSGHHLLCDFSKKSDAWSRFKRSVSLHWIKSASVLAFSFAPAFISPALTFLVATVLIARSEEIKYLVRMNKLKQQEGVV